jgi:hypothetical protein
MLWCSWVTGGMCLGPFSHEICQGLGLDCRLGGVGYVEPHELECPLSDPPRGETVLDNFLEPVRGYHIDQVALEIM